MSVGPTRSGVEPGWTEWPQDMRGISRRCDSQWRFAPLPCGRSRDSGDSGRSCGCSWLKLRFHFAPFATRPNCFDVRGPNKRKYNVVIITTTIIVIHLIIVIFIITIIFTTTIN